MKVKHAIAILLGLPLVVFSDNIKESFEKDDAPLQEYDVIDQDNGGHRQLWDRRDRRREWLNPDRTEVEEIKERRRKVIQAYRRDDLEMDPNFREEFRDRRERARAIKREREARAIKLEREVNRLDREVERLEREADRRAERRAERLARREDDAKRARDMRRKRKAKRHHEKRLGRRADRRGHRRRAHHRRERNRRKAAARRARKERRRRRARLARQARRFDEDGLPLTTTSLTSLDGQGTSSFSSSGDIL